MTRADLEELAKRVEREEPSRELDADVLRAAGHQAVYRGAIMGWEYRPNGVGVWRSMPSPTSSLDAAASLMPEGWVTFIEGNRCTLARPDYPKARGDAPTESRARTAAALRATAQEMPDE